MRLAFLTLCFFLAAPTLLSAESPRFLQIAPVNQTIELNQQPGVSSGCRATLVKPATVRVIKETPTEFEVEWTVDFSGCLWQQMKGLSLKHGFIKKSDIYWEDNLKDELPMVKFEPKTPEVAPKPADCLDTVKQSFIPPAAKNLGLTEFIEYLRYEAGGIKFPDQVDLYQRCYPERKGGVENYQRVKEYLSMAGEVFRMSDRKEPQEVDANLLSCLFRRESGFDPQASGATGIGQHTSVNIADISKRLKTPGAWEAVMWKKFFDKVKSTKRGQEMLHACPGSSPPGEPTFNTKEDAKCPLQSIAAGSIYIMTIQRELARQSKSYGVEWENQLEYLVAIAAAYNLGHGAAGQAVKDLLVQDWVKAIRRKSSEGKYGKDCEVALHISAVRNCLQAQDPWQPMYPKDRPVCEELKGKKIEVKAKVNTCDTGLNPTKALLPNQAKK